jgi:hypothetical protein
LAVTFIISGKSFKEIIFKFISVALIALINYYIGTYQYFLLLSSETARYQLYDMFQTYNQSAYLAGHLFRNSPFELIWGSLLIIGLTVGNLKQIAGESRGITVFRIMSIILFLSSAVLGLVFMYIIKNWEPPKPSYMLFFAYPIESIFVILGVINFTKINNQSKLIKIILLTSLIIFWCWQLINNHNFNYYWTSLIIIAILFISCLIFKKYRLFILFPLVISIVYLNGMELGNGLSWETNYHKRMGIVNTPITKFLQEKIALTPGSTFNGYLDDYYKEHTGSDIIKNIIWPWNVFKSRFKFMFIIKYR